MDRVEGYRHFVNKLWNASRFSLMHLSGEAGGSGDGFDADRFADQLARVGQPGEGGPVAELSLADRWILSRLQRAAAAVDEALREYRFSEAANTLYHFVWDELCDWYIELAKPALTGAGPGATPEALARRFVAQGTLATVLEHALRLLHPMIPFVTEEIWQRLPKPSALPASIMVTLYPRPESHLVDEAAEAEMGLLQEVASAVRTLRSTYTVPPSQVVAIEVRTPSADKRALFERYRGVIEGMSRSRMTLAESGPPIAQAARAVVGADVEVVVPLAGLVDIAAERARIAKEIAKADKDIDLVQKKLQNERFVANAPAEEVEKQRARVAQEEERRRRLSDALATLA
jgi:valyl-tRNA synthetase